MYLILNTFISTNCLAYLHILAVLLCHRLKYLDREEFWQKYNILFFENINGWVYLALYHRSGNFWYQKIFVKSICFEILAHHLLYHDFQKNPFLLTWFYESKLFY